MKKQFYTLLIFLSILLLSACGTSPEAGSAEFTATILEINEDYVLVMPADGEDILRSADKVSFSLSNLADIGAKVGDIVLVVYNGEVMESYPEQIIAKSWSLVKKVDSENSLFKEELADNNSILSKIAEYSYNDVFLSIKLPENWSYSITTAEENVSMEGEYENFGIIFWPEEAPELSFEFFYHPHLVGICGTGVTSTEIEFSSGLKGIKNTEQTNENYWLFLSLNKPYVHYSITGSSSVNIWRTYETIIDEIFNTIEVGGDL